MLYELLAVGQVFFLSVALVTHVRNREARGVSLLVPGTVEDRTASQFRSLYDRDCTLRPG